MNGLCKLSLASYWTFELTCFFIWPFPFDNIRILESFLEKNIPTTYTCGGVQRRTDLLWDEGHVGDVLQWRFLVQKNNCTKFKLIKSNVSAIITWHTWTNHYLLCQCMRIIYKKEEDMRGMYDLWTLIGWCIGVLLFQSFQQPPLFHYPNGGPCGCPIPF